MAKIKIPVNKTPPTKVINSLYEVITQTTVKGKFNPFDGVSTAEVINYAVEVDLFTKKAALLHNGVNAGLMPVTGFTLEHVAGDPKIKIIANLDALLQLRAHWGVCETKEPMDAYEKAVFEVVKQLADEEPPEALLVKVIGGKIIVKSDLKTLVDIVGFDTKFAHVPYTQMVNFSVDFHPASSTGYLLHKNVNIAVFHDVEGWYVGQKKDSKEFYLHLTGDALDNLYPHWKHYFEKFNFSDDILPTKGVETPPVMEKLASMNVEGMITDKQIVSEPNPNEDVTLPALPYAQGGILPGGDKLKVVPKIGVKLKNPQVYDEIVKKAAGAYKIPSGAITAHVAGQGPNMQSILKKPKHSLGSIFAEEKESLGTIDFKTVEAKVAAALDAHGKHPDTKQLAKALNYAKNYGAGPKAMVTLLDPGEEDHTSWVSIDSLGGLENNQSEPPCTPAVDNPASGDGTTEDQETEMSGPNIEKLKQALASGKVGTFTTDPVTQGETMPSQKPLLAEVASTVKDITDMGVAVPNEPVVLATAKYMYQPVHSTSSIYFAVAISPDLKVGAKLEAQSLSVRYEGIALHKTDVAKWLAAAGFKINSSYASIHVKIDAGAMEKSIAQRTLLSMIGASMYQFKSPLPSIERLVKCLALKSYDL